MNEYDTYASLGKDTISARMVEVEPGANTRSTIWRRHEEVVDQRRDGRQVHLGSQRFELFGFGPHVECELGEVFEIGCVDRAGCIVERRDGADRGPYACLACIVLNKIRVFLVSFCV